MGTSWYVLFTCMSKNTGVLFLPSDVRFVSLSDACDQFADKLSLCDVGHCSSRTSQISV